ncbi:MAG TPA: ABC transporter ATP-binding protein [Firmicutes bacterium]|nr:ABC transporter ATP-binding protein [Bacillota bacterium]
MFAVSLQNLSKTYPGGKQAVRRVTLSLEQGEVFGFLGPNGAGKTTTVKLLNGMLVPSEGNCRVLGADPAKDPEKAHALSGVVTEHAQMYDHLTGLQNLAFYAAVFGIPAGEARQRAASLLKQLGLEEAGGRKLSAYSTGMRQRLSLARALIHRPKVLFLDEPTSGLDPESAQNVNRLIRSLARDEGITVFLCTHQLRYAQEICTRYGLMEEGRLLAAGTLEELRSEVFSGAALRLRCANMPEKSPFRKTGEREYETAIQSEEEIPAIVRRIVEAGGEIYAVAVKKPSLEDIYFALTAGGKEGQP